MKSWLYFYIEQTLKIGKPFSKYKGFGIYSELFVTWLENKNSNETMKFPPDPPPIVMSNSIN